jgi:hypothetical protein
MDLIEGIDLIDLTKFLAHERKSSRLLIRLSSFANKVYSELRDLEDTNPVGPRAMKTARAFYDLKLKFKFMGR